MLILLNKFQGLFVSYALTRWWWECQNGSAASGLAWGGWPATQGGDGVAGGGGKGAKCLGHMFITDWSTEGWPHTCKGLKCGIGVIGGNPMVGASQGFTSLFPTLPAVVPYICRLWLQLAASASRANKCFRCDRYFCVIRRKLLSAYAIKTVFVQLIVLN